MRRRVRPRRSSPARRAPNLPGQPRLRPPLGNSRTAMSWVPFRAPSRPRRRVVDDRRTIARGFWRPSGKDGGEPVQRQRRGPSPMGRMEIGVI